ncbi:MAG TPA: hypothetical protein VKR32_13415 [Puia sp.]|nr:hypothetical protein [Puia sp.]
MRVAILSILLLFCVQTTFAYDLQLQPKGISANQPPKKAYYSRGKGVFGLITGLTLGPIGYAAVCIFSHNKVTRKKALLGMEIWTVAILSAAIICLLAYGCKGSGSNMSSGSGSGASGSHGFSCSHGSSSGIELPNFGGGNDVSKKQQHQRPIPCIPVFIMPFF